MADANNRHYTPIEVTPTGAMVGCSIVGSVTFAQWRGLFERRASPCSVFAVMQFVVMRISLLQPIANPMTGCGAAAEQC